VPASVQESTDEYREEMDPLVDFCNFNCVFEPDARITRRSLRRAYENWAEGVGMKPLGNRRFTDAIRKRALAVLPTGSKTKDTITTMRDGGQVERAWRGVRLATSTECVARQNWMRRETDFDDS